MLWPSYSQSSWERTAQGQTFCREYPWAGRLTTACLLFKTKGFRVDWRERYLASTYKTDKALDQTSKKKSVFKKKVSMMDFITEFWVQKKIPVNHWAWWEKLFRIKYTHTYTRVGEEIDNMKEPNLCLTRIPERNGTQKKICEETRMKSFHILWNQQTTELKHSATPKHMEYEETTSKRISKLLNISRE